MNARYFDAHCHVQFEQYDTDRENLVARMLSEEVAGIVVGCDIESSNKAVALSKMHEHLFASAGLHPNHIDEEFDVDAYRELLVHKKVVAIGECGLDYFRPVEVNDEVKERQKELFLKHIDLATEFNKPLIIHSRPSKDTYDAYHDLIEILKESKKENPLLRGDIHFFVGGINEAEALIALGFTISFTAVITFTRAYENVIKAAPLEAILSETDSPYVAPASRRGERNDPLAVIDVVTKIAEIRGEEPEMVREALLSNARRLFAL